MKASVKAKVGSKQSLARRMFNDTVYPQKQKGTETAHGTNHKPLKQSFRVNFLAKGKPVSFLRSKHIAPTLAQKTDRMNLHNTNMQFPYKAAARSGKLRI